jgi:hypothetical protein
MDSQAEPGSEFQDGSIEGAPALWETEVLSWDGPELLIAGSGSSGQAPETHGQNRAQKKADPGKVGFEWGW